MSELIKILLRTIFVLVLIFTMFKLMGKKQVSQMNMFDYITGITIGSIAADISLDIEKDLLGGTICLLIYCLLAVLVSYLSLKSIRMRNFFNGKEVLLIENGKILRDNMAKNKLTINILLTEARIMGYFNIEEINNAILEPNGKISFEPKEKEKPVVQKDILLNSKNKGLVYNLIIDGHIIDNNLETAKKNKKWLKQYLKVKGKKQEDILLLTIDSSDTVKIYPK